MSKIMPNAAELIWLPLGGHKMKLSEVGVERD